MSSTNETGHVKNVNNLEDLITICTGYGAAYSPNNDNIKLPTLQNLLTNAKRELVNVNQKLSEYSIKVGERQEKYKDLKKLTTRLVNALAASKTTERTIENAKAIQKKIQGIRASSVATPPPPEGNTPAAEVKTNSVSQQSFGQLSEHFSKLIILLQSEPNYNPNEVELKVATLSTLLTEMNTSNTNVMNAANEISNARINRNKLFYSDEACLFNCVAEVKKYVKSLYGATSPQYKQVSGLKFTQI
jgi:hypothetical protein